MGMLLASAQIARSFELGRPLSTLFRSALLCVIQRSRPIDRITLTLLVTLRIPYATLRTDGINTRYEHGNRCCFSTSRPASRSATKPRRRRKPEVLVLPLSATGDEEPPRPGQHPTTSASARG